ncbi:archaellum component FlaC [Lachnospiraceae bacterium PFB1-21]
MKLAEALIERADIQKLIGQVKSRMNDNAKVQEGDEPAESMEKLLATYEDLMISLEEIIIRINKTNNITQFGNIALSDALAKRDCLKARIKAYQALYQAATVSYERYGRSEVKFVRYVDIGKLQGKIDSLSKQYREFDTKIQGLNWTVDLVE